MQPIPAPPPTRRFSRTKQPIRWALDSARASVQDMGVDLRRAHVTVPEQFLHGADIVAVLEQVGRERMAEGVARCRLRDARAADGIPDGTLHDGLVQVVPAPLARDALDI